MPYKSKKQSAWMHANKPELAKQFDKDTSKAEFKKLPKRAKKKTARKHKRK